MIMTQKCLFYEESVNRSSICTLRQTHCSQSFSLARDHLSWPYYSLDSLDCFYFSSSAAPIVFSVSSHDC